MKDFLKANTQAFLFTFISLFIFAFVFALFQLGWEIYGISAGLLLIILLIYLIYQRINYQKEKALERQVADLTVTLKEESNNNRLMQRDIEEYFLLWVHQIKTPITASYLLLEENKSENKPLLRQEILKIENYANMALNYLKVLNPSNDMDFRYVVIDELIAPLLKKYRVQFIYSNVTLHYEKYPQTVLTEPNLTSLMIEQLLSNALKYTQEGDIWLKYDEDKQQLIIRDNGIGILEEDLPKIFDKGYAGMNGQLDTKSSGIGLYLVNLISERLKQTVTVKSQKNVGTIFTIQLFNK